MNDLTPDAPFATASPLLKRRQECAVTLGLAIDDCDPLDASQICTAWLESMQTGGPDGPSFGSVRDDAKWWSETAPQHELQEYVYAGMCELGRRALGRSARLRFIAHLWNGLAAEDKREFMRRVAGPGGA